MSIIKKMLSLMTTATILMSFAVMPQVEAAGEVSITPVVEVKLGDASYVAYDGQALSTGDKVRIKYEYAGPETSEIWSEPWYDEDNDIDYPAELKGGKSITVFSFYVDLLDSEYFSAGNPSFYAASAAADWLAADSDSGKTDTGISFSRVKPYVKDGIYKDSGRIAQIVYTLNKDLDKDVVIGPADFNYRALLVSADVTGTETGQEDFTTNNGGVVFNTVTLKAGTVEPPAPTYTKYEVSESSNDNKGKEGSTDKHYSYGIKTTITPNSWTLNALDYKFTKDGGATYVSSKDDADDKLIGWSTPFAGESVLTFAVNVVNIPNGEVVAGSFEYDWIDPAAKQ